MKVVVGAIILLSMQAINPGCAYTILERHAIENNPCLKKGEMDLPDLAIGDIIPTLDWSPGSAPENPSNMVTTFVITVRNLGNAPFEGSILINYSDNESDIKAKRYPLHGKAEILALQAGDSSLVRVESQTRWYEPGTHLVFVLRTDTYPPHTFDPIYYFARDPVCELSYDNNVADFIVP